MLNYDHNNYNYMVIYFSENIVFSTNYLKLEPRVWVVTRIAN